MVFKEIGSKENSLLLVKLPGWQTSNAKTGIAYAVAYAYICSAGFNMVVAILHFWVFKIFEINSLEHANKFAWKFMCTLFYAIKL